MKTEKELIDGFKEKFKKALDHAYAIEFDKLIYGCAFERKLPDGTMERIDPKIVRRMLDETFRILPDLETVHQLIER